MAIRRTSTRRIIAKPAAKRKEAWEKKKRKTSRVAPKRKAAPTKRRSSRVTKKAAVKKRRTSRVAPKRKTSRKAPAKKKTAAKRRTSRVTKKAAVKKRRTSRKAPTKRRTSRAKTTKGKKGRSSTVTEQDTVAATHALLAKWDIPGYRVEFKNRMNPIGLCSYRNKTLSFSREWWTVMSPFERKRTSIHEVAHAVVRADADEYGGNPAGHGKEWKAQMRSMGIKSPRARSTIANSADMARFSQTHVAYRCCGKDSKMTIRMFHSWKKRGARCRCPRGMAASTPVLLTKEDEKKYANYLKTRRLVANGIRAVNVCGCD